MFITNIVASLRAALVVEGGTSLAELIYGFDVSFNEPPPPPPPPDGGFSPPPPPEPPRDPDPSGTPQEPDWDDPIFDDVTIAKVVWSGGKHWDRGLYKLSNGRSAFASKGLSVGQTPFDYEEIRLQGGGITTLPLVLLAIPIRAMAAPSSLRPAPQGDSYRNSNTPGAIRAL